jgi:hypothetical protein
MRRALALTLLAIFSLMLMAPLCAPDAEASLPPCCRRHGKHHCMMQRLLAMSGKPGGPPALQEKCPYWPKGGGAAHVRVYQPEAEPQVFATRVAASVCAAKTELRHDLFFFDSHPKRGPPANLA